MRLTAHETVRLSDMSNSSTYSFSISPSGSQLGSSSSSLSWPPSLTPSAPSVPGPSSSSTLTSTFTGLATPSSTALVSPSPSTSPAQTASKSNEINLTVNETIMLFTIIGFIFLASILNVVHYKKKYMAEKKKREALIEIRSNPLSLNQSQVRGVLPSIYT